ncbi:MAG: P-loop NTPase [SAR324 cluster bacterium]|uniref:P-loop NTPase n=1 Tax=SAR324 cluster bacterium TaxID=2024889 RepID=A0A7X9FP16_9DELT|nr:P-loop NTPase [SAR324 cluster bacterium]
MILAVASGKGGTGKTTVSVNLAKIFGSSIQLLDCDVEEPNAHLFLPTQLELTEVVDTLVPEINTSACDLCGDCSYFCKFNAVAKLGAQIVVFPELCHSCGGCEKVCPKSAIHYINRRIGVIETFKSSNINLIQGRLDIGMSMAPPLIRTLKSKIDRKLPAILDAPPGNSCPVVTTIQDADFVLLVTEPTPFGLHDLRISVETLEALDLAFAVVINRMGIGDRRVHDFCKEKNIRVLSEIPNDRKIAETYSRGELMVDLLPEYKKIFIDLMERILEFQPNKKIQDG